jgi:hypothetical protein
MFKLIVIVGIGILTSCATCKKSKIEKETPTKSVAEMISEESVEINQVRPMREEDMVDITGIVRINKEGCPVLIEMIEGDLYSLVYPVNLEDKFKVNGMKIGFSYLPSRAPMLEGCAAEKVIAVSDVIAK